jgi:hypothetical protein
MVEFVELGQIPEISTSFSSYNTNLPDGVHKTILQKGRLALFPASDRHRHTYIMAGTGSGKTELLKILIHHEVKQKRAVIIIDAHSDLCDQVASWPEFRDDGKAIFISPNYMAGRIPVINPFQLPTGAGSREKEKISNKLALVIGEICQGSGGADASVRMVSVAKNAIRVLLDTSNPTLKDLRDFLGDNPPPALLKRGREHKVESVRWFFESEWLKSDYNASKGAIRARLVNLLSAEDFALMTCGPATVPIYDAVEAGKVLLFSLGAAGKETAQTIGKLIVAMVTIVGDLRKENDIGARRPVHVFIDECQNFTGPSTLTILEELRKYGVFLTLANQSIEQLDKDVQNAVLGNSGVVIMGGGGLVTSVLKKLGVNHDQARELKPQHFYVKWGATPLAMVKTRSDLVGTRWGVKSKEIAFKIDQQRFYQPLETVLPPSGAEVPPKPQPPEEFSRELD